MSRVKTIANNRKPLTCGHCHDPIPKGAGYRWTKPRYGARKVRCLKASCSFKPSDLSSSKTALIHDAIDDARDQLSTAESHDDIQSILQSVADVARDVGQEYRDASDAWAGGSGHPDFQEKADQCESYADELEDWSFSGEDNEETIRSEAATANGGEERDGTGDLEDEAWEATLDEMRGEAEGVLDGFDL